MNELARESLSGLRQWLPRGRTLSEEAWARRHRAISLVLWLHVVALGTVGISTRHGVVHSLLEASVVAACAAAASLRKLKPEAREAAATLGLVVSSAILVHFSDGLIEMHFHFFVMVVVVALYQDWLAFLVGIAFVLFHHGVIGTVAPQDVYSSEAAIANPWGWAALHAGFILAESVACLVAWKKSEQYAALILEHRVRRKEALELNDHVVQGLVVAKASFELGDEDGGKRALDATLERAKGLVSDLLGDEATDGSLVRERAAAVKRS